MDISFASSILGAGYGSLHEFAWPEPDVGNGEMAITLRRGGVTMTKSESIAMDVIE